MSIIRQDSFGANKLTRSVCEKCGYPLTTCLCEHVDIIENQTNIVVLQHPSEQKHSKNTVRPLALCLQNIQVVVGERFRPDRKNLKNYSLVFPAQLPEGDTRGEIPLDIVELLVPACDQGLILLDGTWKKVKKMLYLNPWLRELNRISFDAVENRYWIRKSPTDTSLSTLEAAALGIHEFEPKLQAQQRLAVVFSHFQEKQQSGKVSQK